MAIFANRWGGKGVGCCVGCAEGGGVGRAGRGMCWGGEVGAFVGRGGVGCIFFGGHEGGGLGDCSAREGFVSGGGGGLVEGECGGAILGVPVLVDGVARVCMSVGYRGSWAGLGSSVRSGGTETRREGLSRRAWEGRQVREGWCRGRSAEERPVGRSLSPRGWPESGDGVSLPLRRGGVV